HHIDCDSAAGHRRRSVLHDALDVAQPGPLHLPDAFRFPRLPPMIEIPLISSISAFLTIGVRLSGLMLFAPFFGSVVIPVPVKAILVFALTLLLFPVVGHQIMAAGISNWPLMVF